MLGGILISDGWLEISKSGSTRYAVFFFNKVWIKLNLLFMFFTRLSHFCSYYLIITSTKLKDRKLKGLYFNTRSYPCLKNFIICFM